MIFIFIDWYIFSGLDIMSPLLNASVSTPLLRLFPNQDTIALIYSWYLRKICPLIVSSLSFPLTQRSIVLREINVDVGLEYPRIMSWTCLWRKRRNKWSCNISFSDSRQLVLIKNKAWVVLTTCHCGITFKTDRSNKLIAIICNNVVLNPTEIKNV